MNKNIINDDVCPLQPNDVSENIVDTLPGDNNLVDYHPREEKQMLLVGRAYTWSIDKEKINFKIVVGPEEEHTAFKDTVYNQNADHLSSLIFCSDYLFSYDVSKFLQREKL